METSRGIRGPGPWDEGNLPYLGWLTLIIATLHFIGTFKSKHPSQAEQARNLSIWQQSP